MQPLRPDESANAAHVPRAASSPATDAFEGPLGRRCAFLLNRNARAVNDRLASRLADVVPAGDLFYSRTFSDAEAFADTIVSRGYTRVFTGGGDGTLVAAIRLLRLAAHARGAPMPEVGVLKLGTGNAMARVLGAGRAVVDARHVCARGPASSVSMQWVETDDGIAAPFAGVGYDAEILNDYRWIAQRARSPLAARTADSVAGYLAAVVLRTAPRELRNELARIRVTSAYDALRVVRCGRTGADMERRVAAGEVLYDGPAGIASVGTIPYLGFGFTMFPFAYRKPGYFQLRVCATPVAVVLAHLWPGLWKGRFRHPQLCDFLVRDVTIECDRPMPYQVGGDAAGERSRLAFRLAHEPVTMVALGPRIVPGARRRFGIPRPQRLSLETTKTA